MSYSALEFVKYIDPDTLDFMTASQALKNLRLRLIPDHKGGWIPTEYTVCNRPIYNPDHFIRLYDRPVHSSPPVRGDENDRDYIDRSRRRALRAIRDIMDCNQFDWFLTFTLNGERFSRDDYSTFCKKVNKYLANRVQRYGWSYVACMEYHHDQKNLHLHAVVKADTIKLVDSGTVLRPTGGRPVKLATALRQGFKIEELKTVYNVTDWVDGFSTAIHTYGSPASLAKYITKYITKSENKVGGRWYYSGGDLQRPRYVYDNVDYDLIEPTREYTNAGVSFKVVYIDRELAEGMTFESI
jgi:hypothetical protein